MNTGHKWTAEEDAAAIQMDWPEFNSRVNENAEVPISWDAWRQRRGYIQRNKNLLVAAEEASVRPDGPTNGGPTNFIGLTIGYFDIETTFSNQPRVLYAAVADAWGNVFGFDRDTYPGAGDLVDDSELIEAYVDKLEEFDIVVSWNGKLFDVPVLNGRFATNKSRRRFTPEHHIDLMYQAGMGKMRIGRRSLDHVSNVFDSPNRKTPLDVRTWDRAYTGDPEAYRLIKEHCDADVLVLRDVFADLKPGLRSIGR